ncbi:MAG: GNAT family N-acetyltransferase [Dehalococcoidia bacterium]
MNEEGIAVRRLDESDLEQVHEIDVSERIALIYRSIDGALIAEPIEGEREGWDRARWQSRISDWRRDLEPDVWLGAFAGDRMAGLASLRYELEPGMAQLTSLHVDHAQRRMGIARALLKQVIDLIRSYGANELYVSASETESAVGFYLNQGFRPVTAPHPRLFALEPNDIHMVRPVGRAQP